MIFEIVYPELISTRKLKVDGSNFDSWKNKIELVLSDLKVDYVLTDPKPTDPTDDSSEEHRELHRKWLSDDSTCRHLMLGAMDDKMFGFSNGYKTTEAMMDALTKLFDTNSLPHRMSLLRKYTQHKMSEETNINDHLIEMGSMVVELERAGLPVPEAMQVAILMNSLPESWQSVMGLIMLMKPDEWSLNSVSRHLGVAGDLMAWKSRNGGEDETSNKKQRKEGGFKGNCFSCGKRGHCQSDCPNKD
ncbi:PREDICTED: uncharacterized protein LOC104602546 [Nelumbo nucifera]|uniref:CCHC-type domain-containing protein n=2 Tax=Nelumbo nucifera TaxID=4432 RepID=A0A822Y765_NELNU|nr:PREDICTED: uncharacterized protein LOC104602546 [Nelumbo nucifera]DAD28082.1 TPA_asm: hypothetical protein HUJ06_029550 [Nelumbo nucifera]